MFTTPTLYCPDDLEQRCFIRFSHDGKRFRAYNGKPIGKTCFPNRKLNFLDRRREGERLLKMILDALIAGWNPRQKIGPPKPDRPLPPPPPAPSLSKHIKEVTRSFDKRGWSTTYERDMNRIAAELTRFLDRRHRGLLPAGLTTTILNTFLERYRSSGTYFQNKRTNLSALLAMLYERGVPKGIMDGVNKMKKVEVLNEHFTPAEMDKVLCHLEAHHPNLYLCALMTYGTLLRPHREIRLLRRSELTDELDFIMLGGNRVKNSKIRKVPVPSYIREVLESRGVRDMDRDCYIFTGTTKPFNADYFTTAWTRQKLLMKKKKLVRAEQTLYSFRHSGAVWIMEEWKDIKFLQGLFDHGSAQTTTRYTRSIRIKNATDESQMPQLTRKT